MDGYMPAEIAGRVEDVGVKKAQMDMATMFVLAVLAGAFIALGAAFSTVASTGSTLGFGPTRALAGLVFSLGLILVVVAGAELFTGNNLITLAWASKRVSCFALVRNWVVVFAGNFVGALATAGIVYLSGQWKLNNSAVGATAVALAEAKVQLPFVEALFRGVLCNALVCLAVWLCFGARTTTDKILAIVFPISAFVACGFEHSVANMYFVPLALFIRPELNLPGESALSWPAFLINNLLPVTIGNIIGGAGMVGAVYWFVYLRKKPAAS
ncbi:MAG: formate/nitrite transporter family protein [Planctomycetes bacterium]|nr:formate/nitrite transporter family protein [Planctomycetota bacterium]